MKDNNQFQEEEAIINETCDANAADQTLSTQQDKIDSINFESHLPSISMDDTSTISEVCEIIHNDNGEYLKNPELVEEVDNLLKIGSKEDQIGTLNPNQVLKVRNKFSSTINSSRSIGDGLHANYIMKEGKLLDIINKLLHRSAEKLPKWVKKNMPGSSLRTIQTLIQIGSTPGIEKYPCLGKDRMVALSGASKGMGSNDPVGLLLGDYGIKVDPKSNSSLASLKKKVDAALVCQRAKRQEIKLDFELVHELIQKGYKLNSSVLADLKQEKNKENPNEYLQTLLKNEGKKPKLPELEVATENFGKLTGRMKAVVGKLIDDKEIPTDIKPADIDELINELNKLKNKIGLADA